MIYIVQQGDCIASIAAHYGISWKLIVNDPANKTLFEKRVNPNVLYPGDEITIPDGDDKVISKPTDNFHRFVAKGPAWKCRIKLQDSLGNPLPDLKFNVYVHDEWFAAGKSDAEGIAEFKVTGQQRQAELHVMGNIIPVAIGQLDPVSRITGIQQRLNNMGFSAGMSDGQYGAKTQNAIRKFQKQHIQELSEATGEINDDTRKLLLKLHDADDNCPDFEDELAEEPEDSGGAAAAPATPILWNELIQQLPQDCTDPGGCHHDHEFEPEEGLASGH